MSKPIVLIYNFDAPTEACLRALCERLGFASRVVMPWEYGTSLGALAGLPAPKTAADLSGEAFHEPMLVMGFMLSPQLDAFLQGMREDGIPRVALKAVLTPSNIAWDSRRLRDELAREHEQIRKKG